ncbi:HAD family phosphatase [Mesoplasma syrphidae]|uniref:HAD family phosphatase n=1 Tax=Mesoplasma syrphidae TaxID=225999 RepID=A0A2K9BVX6_9MOLU|nr:HAD family hydrolase [Mesoplasma syrphidae]AUF83870.1 HAD family phosphatase [Mesoplasma syrphidae]
MLKINNDEIKIVISDFDGTLRDGHNVIVQSDDVAAIRKVINDGVYFVLNTGNLPFEMKNSIENISPISNINKYIIVSNGNAIHNYLTNECKVSTYFDNKTTNQIINKIKNLELIYDITSYDLQTIYYSSSEYRNFMIGLGLSKDAHLNRVLLTDSVLQEIEKCPKITLKNVKPKDKELVVNMIENDFPNLNIYATWFSPDGVDFSIAGPNKYQGIISLLKIINNEEKQNIGLNNVVYFGDQHNDYEVFKNLKYAIAVDNAIPEIKELAYEVTLSAQDQGVAAYLKKITI